MTHTLPHKPWYVKGVYLAKYRSEWYRNFCRIPSLAVLLTNQTENTHFLWQKQHAHIESIIIRTTLPESNFCKSWWGNQMAADIFWCNQWPLLLTWINFNPSLLYKRVHALKCLHLDVFEQVSIEQLKHCDYVFVVWNEVLNLQIGY